MKPPRFELLTPTTVDEALRVLAEKGSDAKVLAGGQSLVPLMNLRLVAPAFLVDVTRVAELRRLEVGEGVVAGAAVRQADVEDEQRLRAHAPLLADALPHVAHREIRNAGTVCGSVAHADPAAELPAVAVATDADLHVRSARGDRVVPAAEFFVGFLTTALEPDELLVSIRFPPPAPRTGTAFLEVAPRHGDYALVGVAASVTMSNGAVSAARLAFAGADATPVRGTSAERVLEGEEATPQAIAEVARLAAAELSPPSDVHASSDYRRDLARVLAERALAQAVERAAAGDRQPEVPGA